MRIKKAIFDFQGTLKALSMLIFLIYTKFF